MKMRRLATVIIYIVTSLVGVAAFLYPFWLPAVAVEQSMGMAHAGDAGWVLALLVGLCFLILLLEVQGQGLSAKTVALLGVLVAMNAVLRFAEAAVPGPGGFSPIFVLIVLAGYVYGARFGFLMGAMTLLVSALITGGVGPWLPYQMFTAGWIGMAAPLCRPLVRSLRQEGRRGEVAVLALYGGICGLLYGVVMNIWFWPYASGSPEQYWQPGISVWETVSRYALFYMVTSFAWDAMRLLGNMILIAAVGIPVVSALRRFGRRFQFDYQPMTG
jgi:energy-coupling factor transport system substrate-specific component